MGGGGPDGYGACLEIGKTAHNTLQRFLENEPSLEALADAFQG